MKEPKIYIETSVEKELPKDDAEYIIILHDKTVKKELFYTKDNCFTDQSKDEVTHWLKPFSLPELMEEFARKLENYINTGDNLWLDPITEDTFTRTEILNEFLTQKGIL